MIQIIPRHTKLEKTKAELDAISPTMCAAKWQQVTIHLQNGTTHSCHHPQVHKVGLEEIASNPSALHNSAFKKEQRKLMLEGKRPSECDYCWRVEDGQGDSYSDRIYKSSDNWAFPHIRSLGKMPWDADVQPSYVEVSFGNVCNFKCSYCGPPFSSKWMSEIEHDGPYPTSDAFGSIDWLRDRDMLPIPNREENPYVEAFWKWWPDLYPNLKHFRITGGEPLMNPNTFRVLEWIIDNPRPDLNLSINTNMGVPKPLLDKFLEMSKRIIGEGKVEKLHVYTSAEAQGARAEYIRHGLNYNQWLDDIDRFLTQCPDLSFNIMSTFNALSVTSYKGFLKDMLDIRIAHLGKASVASHAPLLIDFPYLRYPSHQAAYILTDDYLDVLQDAMDWMRAHEVQPENPAVGYNGYHGWECDKLDRVVNVMKSEFAREPSETRASRERANFYRFFSEHDRRRGTDFLGTFPEMSEFYERCRKLAG